MKVLAPLDSGFRVFPAVVTVACHVCSPDVRLFGAASAHPGAMPS